ncbi:MAG: hypothetical protein A2340_05980 [Lentisphaerae bacterium RIFOXYB12_FULL_60_10]|nr:MAG: hypothetical protein A2269_08115 [Lentisphaerae bacterium RIFOXYA12_FULL_60_10]OGV77351.1 MAG: hypothetical protein A2340_05980 [Lentisphaerae bacterium RIFOXYB12_FULL_60_10]
MIGILAALAAGLVGYNGWLNWLENRSWDWRVRHLAAPATGTAHIRLILLDQASLDWMAKELHFGWPWPREAYEPILAFCRRAGARSLTFDMLFTESSVYGMDDDEAFGNAIHQSVPFTGIIWLSQDRGLNRTWSPEIQRNRLTIANTNGPLPAWTHALQTTFASFPVPQVATNARLLATVNAVPDPDAIIRRTIPFQWFDGTPVPSLGLAAWAATQPDASLQLDPDGIRIGDRRIPVDRNGHVILRYRGPSQTHQAVSAAAVFQSEMRTREGLPDTVDPAGFRDTYVVFGVTAAALMDLKPTPISRVYPGVEIHATFLDNLITGDFMRELPSSTAWGSTLILSLACGLAIRLCSNGWQATLVMLLGLTLAPLAGFTAYARGLWFQIAMPLAGAALASLSAIIVNYATEGRQKRFIKNAFQQYLSPVVIDKLVRDPSRLRLGGETRELSIYFSDVQGFTSISEALSPEDLTALLNEYLTAMTDIIMEEGGTIDKYEGDAVIAFWNAPLDLADHPVRAVRSALRCQETLAAMRPRLRERAGRDLFCRIGLNTGKVVVGNMGSHQHFNYTFLGDAGNLAARLEGVNKQFGTPILVSEMTRRLVTTDEFHFREIARVQVVGRKEPVGIYQPYRTATAREQHDLLTRFDTALHQYYAGKFTEALRQFEADSKNDPPSASFARRCRHLLDHPPSGPWQGVWEMTEK